MGYLDDYIKRNNLNVPGASYTDAEPTSNSSGDMLEELAASVNRRYDTTLAPELNVLGDLRKYEDLGLSPGTELVKAQEEGELDSVLANAQSNWSKAFNALAQTVVSEIGLGTLKGFSDLADFVIGGAMRLATGEENDYSNPISQVLEKAQEDFRNFAPIYTKPGVSIDNGGLTDFGWWMSNLPSIASSLTLLLPARAASIGVAKLGSLAKATNVGRKASVGSRRLLGNIVGGQTKLKRAETMAKFGFEGTVMRVAENYQEARQTYNDMYPQALETLNSMSPDEYQSYVESHKEILGEDINYNDKESVAKRIASYSADETFKSDMLNAVFDIYQLYGLRNIGRIMNSPGRASVRRLDKLSRKFPNKSKEELEEILKSRSKLRKAWDWTGDAARGSWVAVTSELSEGVEEAINYAAQQEGLSYGQALLKQGLDESTGKYNLSDKEKDDLTRKGFFSKNRLLPFSRLTQQAFEDYIKAPELHDSAFWGLVGGVVFGAAGSGVNKISQAYNAYNTKKELRKAGVDEEQIPDYVSLMQTPEIQARISNIESRNIKFNELKSKLKTINDDHKDPLNEDRVLETEEDRELARKRAIEDHDISLLLSSMDVGHWGITKAYLESDGVRDALVEAGIMTQEEAKERQEQIRSLANRVEKLYNDNIKTIDNALSRYEDDNVDLTDIPIETFGIVARLNISHQIAADRLQEDIKRTTDDTTEEETRVQQALADTGIQVRQLVTARVQAQALGELMAERKEIANSKEAATLSGQMQLDMLDKKISLVRQQLLSNVNTQEDYARVIDAFRFASGVRKKDDSYYFDEYDEDFKKIDEAIRTNDVKTLKEIGVFGNLQNNAPYENLIHLVSEDGTESNINLSSIASDLELIDNAYEILYNTDKNRTISNLKDISKKLDENYHNLAALELQRQLELQQIALSKEDVAKEVDRINNTMSATRPALLDHAMEGLQHLAKKYGKDAIIEEVNRLNKNEKRGEAYNNFTQDEKRWFDDYSKVMALDKGINSNLYKRSIRAINLNDIYEFTTTEDMFKAKAEVKPEETTQTNTQANTQAAQNSSASQNQNAATPSQQLNTSLAQIPAPSVEPARQQIEPQIPTETPAETPKTKTTKVNIVADINDANPSGLTIESIPESNTGIDALEDEEGNITLDFIHAEDEAVQDWMLESKDLFETTDGNEVSNNNKDYEIIKNPIVKRTNSGIEVIEKGQLNPIDSSTGELESVTPPPSTGRTDEPERSDDEDLAARAAEFKSDDLGEDIANAIIDYIRDNDTYNYNDVASYLRERFKDRDQARLESLLESFVTDPEMSTLADMAGRKVEAVPIAKVVSFSALNDIVKTENAKKKVNELLDTAFKDILKNYASHSALDFDSVNGKYVLSLENLLRYCTDVTENKDDADRLYTMLTNIIDKSDEYVVIDGTTPIAEVIANAKKSYEERKAELADAHNATSINIKSYIGKLIRQLNNKDISDEDKESIRRQLEDIYDALDNSKPGDNLIHINQSGNNQRGIDFFITNSKGIDVKVGEIPAPRSINGGTHWEMNNMGWLTDVPKGNGSSKFQRVITRILVPEANDSVGQEINKLLREYISKRGNKNIAHKIMDLVRSDAELRERLHNKLSNNLDDMCVRHLVDLYNYVKQINDMFLQTYGLTREQADTALRDNRLESIQNWMDKLKVSYNNAEYLYNDPFVPIKIETIAEGNAIVTSTQRPVSQAIGSEHKGLARIGIVTFNKPGEVTVAGGVSVKNNFGKVGTPVLTIHGAHDAVAQIQVTTQTLDSDNFKNNKTIQSIYDDVMSELEKHLDSWGESHDESELLDFFRKLLERGYRGNVPLFQGVSVEPLTGGFNGFQLIYTAKDGETHYTKFFSTQTVQGNTYAVSNVRFEIKNKRGEVKGISLNPKTKTPDTRKQAIKDLKEHLKECLKFNLDFAYINSDNANIPVQGFATRKDGKFVINITGDKEYEFNSFNDFVIENDVINAATKPNSHGRNFNRPGEGGFMDSNGLTYAIVSEDNNTTPVEETKIEPEKDKTPYRQKGNEIAELVSKKLSKTLFGELKADTKVNLSKEILKVLLNNKQLNILNNSGIINKLLHKNVIFVEDYNELTYETKRRDNDGNIITVTEKVPATAKAAYHKESVTYKRPDGTEITIAADTIVISSRWVELANGTLDEQEKAARDIIHENIHRILTFPENSGWVAKAQEVLNAFNNAELTDVDDIAVRNVYSKIGLEEFLVESLTRPELMRVLNKIPTDLPIGPKAKLKKGNLLQRVLKLIGELFGVDVNENSLLEKEFKLFEDLGKTTEVKKEEPAQQQPQQVPVQQQTQTPVAQPAQTPAQAAQQGVQNTGGRRRKVEFSTRNDLGIASKSSIQEALEDDARTWFDEAVNNGLISITCK